MGRKLSSRQSLGKLLLKGFSTGGRSASRKRTAARRKPWAPSIIFRKPKGALRRQEVIIKEVIQRVVVQEQVPVVKAPVVQVEQHGQREQLLTTRLIRPDERFRQAVESFILDQRSEHTKNAYSKDLKRFIKFLLSRNFERGPEQMDRRILVAYKDSLVSEGLEHTTIDRHLATLKSFFRWLVEEELILKNPAENVRFLNPKRISRTNAFTDDEVRRVLEIPDRHSRSGAMHWAILTLLFYCGMRRSELVGLRTSSLSQERNHPILKLRGKGDSERLIPLVPQAKDALDNYLRITRKRPEEDQVLFTPHRNNRTGVQEKPLDTSAIFYIVRKYARLAGITRRVSPHSCRATAISHARDKQASDRAIQEYAGWASPDMITRYDKRKSAIEKSAAHVIRYDEATE